MLPFLVRVQHDSLDEPEAEGVLRRGVTPVPVLLDVRREEASERAAEEDAVEGEDVRSAGKRTRGDDVADHILPQMLVGDMDGDVRDGAVQVRGVLEKRKVRSPSADAIVEVGVAVVDAHEACGREKLSDPDERLRLPGRLDESAEEGSATVEKV